VWYMVIAFTLCPRKYSYPTLFVFVWSHIRYVFIHISIQEAFVFVSNRYLLLSLASKNYKNKYNISDILAPNTLESSSKHKIFYRHKYKQLHHIQLKGFVWIPKFSLLILDIWIGKIDNFIPQLFWKAQIHPTVDTIFWHVSKKVILWRGGCRFGRNQKMYRIRIGRWGATDGPEGIFHKNADPVIWWSADEKLPMNQEGKRKSKLYRDSDNSIVIFS